MYIHTHTHIYIYINLFHVVCFSANIASFFTLHTLDTTFLVFAGSFYRMNMHMCVYMYIYVCVGVW